MRWITDLHLDRSTPEARASLDASLKLVAGEPLLITGDISNSSRIIADLDLLADLTGGPIWFVLGNHDHFGASIATVRDDVIALSERRPAIQWLPRAGAVKVDETTALVGVDGWADGRFGDALHTPLRLNDDRLIVELARQDTILERITVRRVLADADAARLKALLAEALTLGAQKIIVATHVPPFVEALKPGARSAHPNWHPLLLCGATGEVLKTFAATHQEIEMMVLAGHTHVGHAARISENLRVRVGVPREITG